MPANYSVNARHARLNSCLNATGVAAGTSVNGVTAGAGQLAILASPGGTLLVTVVLPGTPPFTLADISATTVATLVGVTLSATPSAAGTAGAAEFRDSGGATVISGLTVGVGPTFDVNVSTTNVQLAVAFQVNSATITTS